MKTKLLPLLFFTFTANAADLSTTFSGTYSKITVNNTIAYTGSVVNKGSDAASNVQLLFYMPPRNISVGNLPSGCWNSNTKIICTIGDLSGGDSASRTISVFYTKKGAAVATVNAISDSNDTNYKNNSTRLVTNVTSSTNIENSPLIPNLSNAKVNPITVVQGNAVTFIANLDAPLPSGYSVKVNYDGNNYALTGSGTNYSLSNTPSSTGLKTFRTGIYDSFNNLKSEMTGTFEVTKLNSPPTLSIVSGADSVTAGTAYTLQLKASDADGNLSNIQITNWGDGSSDYQNASNNATLSFSHTFNIAGSYTISATAYDIANASSTAISKTVTVANAAVVTPPATNTGTTTTTSKYTKIANNGSVLSDSATLGTNPTDWACTKDNVTGLIWEVKTDDGGLRDKDWYYSWYNPNNDTNGGGKAGYQNNGSCKGSNCDTYAFPKVVNNQSLCGATNWRMPTIQELGGLLVCSDGKYTTYDGSDGTKNIIYCTNSGYVTSPTINTTYFPDIVVLKDNYLFWSSSSVAYVSGYGSSDYAWGVGFYGGYSGSYIKINNGYVRLVR